MSGSIFLVRDEELVELRPSGYTSEDDLQQLIARFPNLLAGDDTTPEERRRWLLVGRELGLPDDDDSADRWAVDHLFLDQDAIPTLVEVKLVRDTRIRREVVGQILDYAANAVVYWPTERLREQFETGCHQRGDDPETALIAVAGEQTDPDTFWERAGDNLRAGRLRLVFVADEIPRELARIIEFLNGQMRADVFGIEIRRYTDQLTHTYVPRLIGQSAAADARKNTSGRPKREWNEHSFFDALSTSRPPAETAVARNLRDWMLEHGYSETFGTGAVHGSWIPILETSGREYRPFALYTSGTIGIHAPPLAKRPPFDNRQTRLELLNRLEQIPGVTIPTDTIDSQTRYPVIPLATLAAHPDNLNQFEDVFAWFATTASS